MYQGGQDAFMLSMANTYMYNQYPDNSELLDPPRESSKYGSMEMQPSGQPNPVSASPRDNSQSWIEQLSPKDLDPETVRSEFSTMIAFALPLGLGIASR